MDVGIELDAGRSLSWKMSTLGRARTTVDASALRIALASCAGNARLGTTPVASRGRETVPQARGSASAPALNTSGATRKCLAPTYNLDAARASGSRGAVQAIDRPPTLRRGPRPGSQPDLGAAADSPCAVGGQDGG